MSGPTQLRAFMRLVVGVGGDGAPTVNWPIKWARKNHSPAITICLSDPLPGFECMLVYTYCPHGSFVCLHI